LPLFGHLLTGMLMGFPAEAQTTRTVVKGRVLDALKTPVAGANVVASRRNAAPDPGIISDDLGFFSLSLRPGPYTIKVSMTNFRDVTRSIEVGTSEMEIDAFVLPVAPVQSSVDVSEDVGYLTVASSFATRTITPLIDVPQTVNVVTQQQVQDQLMLGIGDVVRYVPGVSAHQGENNRDEVIIRGVDSSADFFVNGMRDDVQYYRDLYNVDRVEVLKGPNELTSGRGGGGGVVNRVTKEAGQTSFGQLVIQGGSFYNKRVAIDFNHPFTTKFAFRVNCVYENSDSFRHDVGLQRYAVNPTLTYNPTQTTKVTVGFENLRDTRTADRGITSFHGSPVDVPIETFYGNPNASHVRALVNLGSVLVEHQAGNLIIRNRSLIGNYDRGYQNFVPGVVSPDQTLVNLTAYNNARVDRQPPEHRIFQRKKRVDSSSLLRPYDYDSGQFYPQPYGCEQPRPHQSGWRLCSGPSKPDTLHPVSRRSSIRPF
jgi:outer membrane receptor protein involved in Fe transport